jgi:hypothetical protein
MTRAARAWAAGSHCGMCPRFPVYPRECVEPEPITWRDDVDDEGGTECPVFIGKRFEKYFFGWRQMEKGFLPHPGGWADQPAHWIEAFEIIGSVVAEAQARRLEQMKQVEH